jgi:hypothetical protein
MHFTLWISLYICPMQVIQCIQLYAPSGAYNTVYNFLQFHDLSFALRSYSSRMSKVMTVKKGFMNRTKHTPIKKPVKSVKIGRVVTNILTEKTTSEKKKTKLLLHLNSEDDSQTLEDSEFRKLVGRSPGKPETLKRKTAHARGL